jgi:serine-threonine kinase receptor-associated protein
MNGYRPSPSPHGGLSASRPHSGAQTPDPLHQNGSSNGNGTATNGQGQVKVQPLLCSGHTRPVVHLQFSNLSVTGLVTLTLADA